MKNRLEELRKARGLRRYNPSILLAFKLSRYFGVPIEEIFIYEEEPS